MREAPRFGTDYCRTCHTRTRWTFTGYDGKAYTDRPRPFYRTCTACGTMYLVLDDVDDVDGFARAMLRRWMRRSFDGQVAATGALPQTGRIDFEDVHAQLVMFVWRAYERFDPTKGLTWLSYITFRAQSHLPQIIDDALGNAGTRRQTPKAHAVSDTLDAIPDGASGGPDDRGYDEALRRGVEVLSDDRAGSVRWILQRGHSVCDELLAARGR